MVVVQLYLQLDKLKIGLYQQWEDYFITNRMNGTDEINRNRVTGLQLYPSLL